MCDIWSPLQNIMKLRMLLLMAICPYCWGCHGSRLLGCVFILVHGATVNLQVWKSLRKHLIKKKICKSASVKVLFGLGVPVIHPFFFLMQWRAALLRIFGKHTKWRWKCSLDAFHRPAHICVPIQLSCFHVTLHWMFRWHKYTGINCIKQILFTHLI